MTKQDILSPGELQVRTALALDGQGYPQPEDVALQLSTSLLALLVVLMNIYYLGEVSASTWHGHRCQSFILENSIACALPRFREIDNTAPMYAPVCTDCG